MTAFPPPGSPSPLPPPTAPGPTAPTGPPTPPWSPGPPAVTQQFSALPEIEPVLEPTPVWKKWWFIVGLLVVVGGIVAAIVVSSGDDTKTVSPQESAPEVTAPEISIPEISLPEISVPDITVPVEIVPEATDESETTDAPTTSADAAEAFVAGDSITLDDGTVVRVNSVTPNAPPVDDFYPPDAGTTLSRIDIEACGGSDGFSSNSLYWLGFLDDNTSVDSFIFGGDLEAVTVAPGACIRGSVDLQVPDGRALSSVVMRGSTFEEAARWDVTSSNPVSGPLVPPKPVATSPLGTTVTLADGSTAVLESVVPNAPPPDEFSTPEPGRQLVQLDVEQCAGTSPLDVNPLYWYAAGADNRTGSTTFIGDTLAVITLAPGECAAGTVMIDLPADASVATAFLSDSTLNEVARWQAS